MNTLIEKLMRNQSGHWGYIEPVYGISHLEDLVHQIGSRTGARTERINLREQTEASGTTAVAADAVSNSCLEFERLFKNSEANGFKCFCCVIEGFDILDVSSQCKLLGFTRRIREQSSNIQVQTLIHGSWNRYTLMKQWILHPNISPVPDQKNVHCSDGTSIEDLARFLGLTGQLNELDYRAVEAVLELTGGDLLLIEEIVEVIRTHKITLRGFQEAAQDVVTSGNVFDDLALRLARLSPGSDIILGRILELLALTVDARSPQIEELRLLGLIQLQKRGDKVVASIPSPLMERALRLNWHRFKPGIGRVSASSDLNWPLKAINGHAYVLVMKIEALLRNWLVSSLSNQQEDDWTSSIKDVKTPGSSADLVSDEIRALGSQLIGILFPGLDPTLNSEEPAVDGTSAAAGSSMAKKDSEKQMVGIIDSAGDWRNRVVSNVFVRLSETGLPGFFTTGALVGALMHSKGRMPEIVKRVFSQREDLKRFLTKFSAIRSAVAHNQALAFSALEDLESLLRELEIRLGTQN